MTDNALSIPVSPGVGGLSAYISAVNALPLLSAQEESRLAERLREHNDTEAARCLVLANLRLVVSVSRNYSGYGLNQGDLIQEGNIGLMKAVRKFDPSYGARLATFAMYWIKAEINEFVIRNWRIVKIATTKAQRKLFFSKNRLMKKGATGGESNQLIAKDLGVKPEEVEEMRGRLYNTETVSLSNEDNDNPGAEVYLADTNPMADTETLLEEHYRHQALEKAMAGISERERDVLKARRLAEPPVTLQVLAKKHGISIERVRQIENIAIKKIADLMRDQFALPAA